LLSNIRGRSSVLLGVRDFGAMALSRISDFLLFSVDLAILSPIYLSQ
jgi:hypothetical protein